MNRSPSHALSLVVPKKRRMISASVLMILVAGFAFSSLAIGQAPMSFGDAWFGLIGGPGSGIEGRILWDLRMPRILTAILSGGAMALAGLMMQTLFRNPLADAWSLGLTAGGQFGAALVVVGGAILVPELVPLLGLFKDVPLVIGSALGAAAVAIFMASLARKVGTITLLVFGLMLGFLAQGLISVVLHFTNRSQGRIYASWNDGSFAAVQWPDLPILSLPVLLGLGLAVTLAKPLNALLLGEKYAASLGTDVPRLRRLVLLAVLLLAAPVTAYCGPILFIGLIVPHIARGLVKTARIAPLMGPTILLGSLLAIMGDFIVHLPWRDHFLHLNAILSIIGAPTVMFLLVTSRGVRADAR